MELSNHNRYQTARLYNLDSGEYLRTDRVQWKPQPTDLLHTVTVYDTIDLLAWKYYNAKRENADKYWWLIADANKIHNPLDLSNYVGKQIVIPDITLLDFVRNAF